MHDWCLHENTCMIEDRLFPFCVPLVRVTENDSLGNPLVIRDERRPISWRPRVSVHALRSSPIGSMLERKSRTWNLVTEATSACGSLSTLMFWRSCLRKNGSITLYHIHTYNKNMIDSSMYSTYWLTRSSLKYSGCHLC